MNCARVLHALGSHPQPALMPVDLARCLSLSQHQPLNQLLSMSLKQAQRRYQPTDCPPRTGLHSPHPSSSSSPLSPSPPQPSFPVPSSPRSCFRRDSGGVTKKRVVFADAKGLALTAVRLFIPEPVTPASTLMMKHSLARLQGQQSTLNKLPRYKLRLGFPQPTLDFKAFLARLRDTCVQLESCNTSEHTLSGKVRVSHASIDKAVHVMVTFDSWRSQHDIPCTFLQQQRYGGADMDVFAFDLNLPKNIDANERVEFWVSFKPEPGATLYWDNNGGQNYRVFVEKDGSDGYQGDGYQGNGYQGDAFRCYTTLSRNRPPSWPSHVPLGTQNSDPQYPQRSLSNRVREWKTFCSPK